MAPPLNCPSPAPPGLGGTLAQKGCWLPSPAENSRRLLFRVVGVPASSVRLQKAGEEAR